MHSFSVMMFSLPLAMGALLHPCGSTRHPPTRIVRRQPVRIAMVDSASVADAINSLANPPDPHTLDNLVPDMINTAFIAALGLAGAYVTQVRARRSPHTSHPPFPNLRVSQTRATIHTTACRGL